MIRFEQTFGTHTGRSLEFDQECIAFGRLPDLDVSFDPNADLDASGRHAEVRRSAEGWVLVDVGSRNGTFIRGQAVTQHLLRDGDEIEFGSGGPRLRVRLAVTPSLGSEGYAAPGAATAAATPIESSHAAGEAATMLAASSPTPQWVEPTAGGPPRQLPQTDRPPPPSAAPIAPPSAAAVSGERRYGERTVGLMIGAALGRAGLNPAGPESSKEGASAGLLLAIGCLGFTVFVLALALVAVLVYA